MAHETQMFHTILSYKNTPPGTQVKIGENLPNVMLELKRFNIRQKASLHPHMIKPKTMNNVP